MTGSRSDPAGATTRLAVAATAAGLGDAGQAFDAFCHAHRLTEAVRRRMQLVLDEVLSNVVRHGRAPETAPIDLAFSWAPSRLVVEVRDAASPFNPLDLPPPDTTLPLEARAPGGLGIALVRAMLDEVTYARRDEHNILTLTLHVR